MNDRTSDRTVERVVLHPSLYLRTGKALTQQKVGGVVKLPESAAKRLDQKGFTAAKGSGAAAEVVQPKVETKVSAKVEAKA